LKQHCKLGIYYHNTQQGRCSGRSVERNARSGQTVRWNEGRTPNSSSQYELEEARGPN